MSRLIEHLARQAKSNMKNVITLLVLANAGQEGDLTGTKNEASPDYDLSVGGHMLDGFDTGRAWLQQVGLVAGTPPRVDTSSMLAALARRDDPSGYDLIQEALDYFRSVITGIEALDSLPEERLDQTYQVGFYGQQTVLSTLGLEDHHTAHHHARALEILTGKGLLREATEADNARIAELLAA